jgi:membrane protease YdiL (CAAX protease family)
MNKNQLILSGLFITLFIFLAANFAGVKLQLNADFLPHSFSIHTLMLLLTIIIILGMKDRVGYSISLPRINYLWKPVLIAIVVTIGVNILMEGISVILKKSTIPAVAGETVEGHALLASMDPLQIILFVFFYASIAEEILFRGFLQNYLHPLKTGGFRLFKRQISLPVIIAALAFGAAHLVLIKTGANMMFITRIVIFTSCLGLVAGYYQEKHNNNSYAIIVHMAGNLPAVIAAFFM